jgi:hypothetical protein
VGQAVPETPEGDLVFPLAAALQNIQGLRNFRVMVDPAAGVVRLTADARTLARLALGLGGADANRPDPRIYADYTPATLRLSRGEVSASDPIIIPVLPDRGNPTYDASWYRQQITANAWNTGTPIPGQADRLYVFWRRSASAGSPGPALIYKVMRPGVQIRSSNPETGLPFIRGLNGFTASAAPEEVNPTNGQVYFPYALEGQQVTVQYVDFYGVNRTETHTVRWLDETGETVVPMETSVNEGSLDAFPTFEEVAMGSPAAPVRKLERIWLFWSSTRGSAGDLFFATLAPRIGPDVNVGNSIVFTSGQPGFRPGVSANAVRQMAAERAAYERSRPFTLTLPVRRGLPATPAPRAAGRTAPRAR